MNRSTGKVSENYKGRLQKNTTHFVTTQRFEPRSMRCLPAVSDLWSGKENIRTLLRLHCQLRPACFKSRRTEVSPDRMKARGTIKSHDSTPIAQLPVVSIVQEVRYKVLLSQDKEEDKTHPCRITHISETPVCDIQPEPMMFVRSRRAFVADKIQGVLGSTSTNT